MSSEETVEERKARVAAEAEYLAKLQERVNGPDSSGYVTIQLVCPVKVNGNTIGVLSLRPVRVRDVRKCRGLGSPLLVTEAYADALAEPAGVFDELLSDDDHAAVLVGVRDVLGKYRAGGERASA